MKDEKKAPRGDYSVDEILAEAHVMKERESAGKKAAPPRAGAPEHSAPAAAEKPAGAEEIARRAQEALSTEAGEAGPAQGAGAPKAQKPKRKKRFSLFHRRKKEEDSDDGMKDDVYYGLQLKPLEEYRREYEETVQFDSIRPEAEKKAAPPEAQKPAEGAGGAGQPSFPYLFDRDSAESGGADPQLSEAVEKIHRERQKRLEKIMEHAGLDAGDVFSAEDSAPGPEVPPPSVRPEIPPVPPSGFPVQKPAAPPAAPPGPMHPAPPPAVTPPAGPPRPAAPETPPAPRAPELSRREKPGAEEKPAAPAESPEAPPKAENAAPEEPPAPVREPGVPAPAKDRRPAPPPRQEPKDRPVPGYRLENPPLHVIDPGGIGQALAAEAAAYKIPPAPEAEPIPFPAEKPAPPKPEAAESPRKQPEKEPGPADSPSGPPGGIDRLPLPQAAPPEPKKRFRLFGSEEDPAQAPAEPRGAEEPLEDYDSPADAPSVQNDLSASVRRLFLRFAVTGLCTVLLLALGFFAEHPALLPPALHSLYDPQALRIAQLIFLLICGAFCAPALWNGLSGLFAFRANTDSAAAVAAAAALLQNLMFLFLPGGSGLHLYTPLAAAALFLNTAGKLSMARRILRNFRFLTSPGQKYAVQMFRDHNTAIRLVPASADGDPKIAYQAKAGFLSGFLRLSYASDPADHISQLLAPVGFIAGLALCAAAAFLTKDGAKALTVFAASACVCVPFANTLCVNLPLARVSKIAARCGGMAVGWPAVDRFSEVGWILADARDLFPRGTVTLSGIQTFSGGRIDRAILDATALAEAAGGPLNDLFSQIVKSRDDILPRVERSSYEDGAGVCGVVSGRDVLIGNRELLKKHGVAAPSPEYEGKYLRAGKVPLYLACGGALVAMFLVSYRSDRRRAKELRRLEYNGIGLAVRTRDPNVTPRLLASCFGLSEHSVVILPEKLGEFYRALRRNPPERPEAVLATRGRATAMMRLLTACVRQRGNIAIAVALQVAGVALGFALVAMLVFSSSLGQITATAMAAFEAFWALAVIFVPRLRKP